MIRRPVKLAVPALFCLALAACGGSETPGAVADTAERSYVKSNADAVQADKAATRAATKAATRAAEARGKAGAAAELNRLDANEKERVADAK